MEKNLFLPFKIFLVLIVSVWLIVLIRNDLKRFDYIGQPTDIRDTITIMGEGRVTAVPDIAMIQAGIEIEKSTVALAQQENTRQMNALIEAVKKLGVESKDIQTVDYNVYPNYDYRDGTQSLRGYAVRQSVNIKIRDLTKVGSVLSAVAEQGANQIGGLNFTIDEPEALRQQAREAALKQAKEKAETLAKTMGVKLGKITSFTESEGGSFQPIYKSFTMEAGFGGGAPAPDVEAGSSTITVIATVSYEIL